MQELSRFTLSDLARHALYYDLLYSSQCTYVLIAVPYATVPIISSVACLKARRGEVRRAGGA